MAANTRQTGKAPFSNVRLVEWSLVATLIALLVLVFLHRVRVVQRQAELAAVQTALGAMRTAFVIDHLQRVSANRTQASAPPQRNPFVLLQSRPANYFGEIERAGAVVVPPGTWVFDGSCGCVGYMPADASEFDSPSGDTMAWYQVDTQSAPFALTAKEAFLWQGRVMN